MAEFRTPATASIDAMYDTGWLAYTEGRCAEALEALNRVLALVATHERARFARGLCFLSLDQPLEAERELSTYLSLVAFQQLNTCDALFFRAMALSALGERHRALADLDAAIAHKPGCTGGCACGMSCRAPDAVLARFALLLDHGTRAAYTGERASTALGDAAPAGEREEPSSGEAASHAFTLDGPVWTVPMHQLGVALERAGAADRIALLVDSSLDRSVDAFFLYMASTLVEVKRLVVRMRTGAATLDDAREELRSQLVQAMRWGHNLVLRLGTSAPDFSRLCSPEHFPIELLEDATALPIGANLVGHALGAVLRPEDMQAGVFVVAQKFRIIVTSNFAADTFESYLVPSLPRWSALQPICVVTQTSFREGQADTGSAEHPAPSGAASVLAADTGAQRPLDADRLTLFLRS